MWDRSSSEVVGLHHGGFHFRLYLQFGLLLQRQQQRRPRKYFGLLAVLSYWRSWGREGFLPPRLPPPPSSRFWAGGKARKKGAIRQEEISLTKRDREEEEKWRATPEGLRWRWDEKRERPTGGRGRGKRKWSRGVSEKKQVFGGGVVEKALG